MNRLSKYIFIASSILLLWTSCTDDEILTAPSAYTPTVFTTGIRLDLSPDLSELVTAVITYYGTDGVHEVVLSDDMYEQVVNERVETGIAYRYNQDTLQICVTDSDFIKLQFRPKEETVFDDTKTYALSMEFSIYYYNHLYTDIDMTNLYRHFRTYYEVPLDVKPSEDGRYNAEQAREYIRQLCSKPLKIHIQLIPVGGCVQR